MKHMPKAEVPLAPYLSFRTFQTGLETLRRFCPDQLDKSVFPDMSFTNQANMINGLQFLKLTSEANEKTPLLDQLLSDIENRNTWAIVLGTAYPDVMSARPNQISPARLKELIRGYGNSGSTVDKAYRFFLAAAMQAGVDLSPPLEKSVRAATGASPHRSTVRKRSTKPAKITPAQPQAAVGTAENGKWSFLRDKFPEFDPSWTPEVQQKWFDSLNRLIDETTEEGS